MDREIRKIVEKVIKVREFEKKVQEIYNYNDIQSPVHLSIGQELTSVLISQNVTVLDRIVGNYRSHAISVALSENIKSLVLELMAKEEGVSGGKAGSMHLSVPEKGLMWTSAIVGTGVPVACGIAEALKRDKIGGICTVMFGDGAIEEGGVIEAINVAQTRKLPIVFVLEDNELAIHAKKKVRTSIKEYGELADAYGLKNWKVTYKEPVKMINIFKDAYKYCRENKVPVMLDVKCFRWIEHVGIGVDWSLGFRNESEIDEWKEVDIIENPNVMGIEDDYIQEKMTEYKDYFSILFNACRKMENARPENLTKNT